MTLNTEQPLSETQILRKISAFLAVIVIAVAFAFCYFASSFFLTIVLASLLAILIDPIINYSERLGIARSISSALIVVVVMALLGGATYWSYTRLSTLPETLPTYTAALKRVIQPLSPEDRKSSSHCRKPDRTRWQTEKGRRSHREAGFNLAYLFDSRGWLCFWHFDQ